MKDSKFIRDFEKKVTNTIYRYNLLNKKDKVLVACSGGKDSTVVLHILKKENYNVSAIYIDLGMGEYSKRCLQNLKQLCCNLKIKLSVLTMKKEFGCNMCYIRSSIQEKNKLSNCTICGVIKRWILNKKARQLKATKLVTGHNLDDEAQTVLVNFFKGNVLLGINSGPSTGIISDKKFIPRIKPLYFIDEREIKKYSELMHFPVNYEKCPCAIGTYRIETRKFLNEMDTETKNNIVNNFLKMIHPLRNYFHDNLERLKYCKICHEPSRNEVCNVCKLLMRKK